MWCIFGAAYLQLWLNKSQQLLHHPRESLHGPFHCGRGTESPQNSYPSPCRWLGWGRRGQFFLRQCPPMENMHQTTLLYPSYFYIYFYFCNFWRKRRSHLQPPVDLESASDGKLCECHSSFIPAARRAELGPLSSECLPRSTIDPAGRGRWQPLSQRERTTPESSLYHSGHREGWSPRWKCWC